MIINGKLYLPLTAETQEIQEEVMRLKRQGLSNTEIGERVERSVQFVKRLIELDGES